jgi:signal transduction histidine kinase
MGRLLASAAEAPLDFEDRTGAATVLAGLGDTPGAVGARLLAPDGRTLAAWGRPPEGELADLGSEAVELVDGTVRVRVPVATRAGGLGALVVDLADDELGARRAETGRVLAVALGLALLAGILAAGGVGAVTARPLQRMTAVARRIAAGDARAWADLERGGGAEAQALADALDTMLQQLMVHQEQLAARARDIEGLNAELEARVAARTAELERANGALAERLEELRRAQEQLIVADRRVTLGRLAAGVAHEINNPLAYMTSNLELLETELSALRLTLDDGGHPATLARLTELVEAVQDTRHGAERVRYIVKGLKTFSRGDDDERSLIDPAEPLDAALEMARHEIRGRAQLDTALGPLPRVRANAIRLSQVFLNLLVNAAQAVAPGEPGRNRIAVSSRTAEDGWAEVAVSDTGAGIAPEQLARIFEPFFTTKRAGEGTGLGLTICHEIVSRLGGRLEVESRVGVGTTFVVRLPPAGANAAEEPGQPRREPPRRLDARVG